MTKFKAFYLLSMFFFFVLIPGGLHLAHADELPGLTEGFDVNDVSFLFPLKDGKPLPALNLVANSLISTEIFGQVLTFEKKYKQDALPYSDAKNISQASNWYVTSMRFDPCGDTMILKDMNSASNQDEFSLVRKGPACVPRLRLVVQPFNDFGFPYPTALHLLYSLNSSAGNSFIDALALAKQTALTNYSLKTTGLPLAIHPSLFFEAQSLDMQAVANVLKSAVLTTLAHPGVKIDIVTLIIRASVNHWKFVGGTVREARWQRFVTEFSQQFNNGSDPEILSGVEDLNCTIFSVCLLKPLPVKAELSPKGVIVSEIFQDNAEMKLNQTPGHRTNEVLIKAETIDQVSQVHFFNTNCVSCHQSSNLRDREMLHTQDSEEKIYWDGLTPFVPKKYLNAFTNNVINFGYFGTIPRISTRTAAESLYVAHMINASRGLKNPAARISDHNQFWQCIVSQDDSSSCFKILTSLKENL